MPPQTQILNPLSDDRWDERLGCHESVNFFHSRAWAKVLFETYRYRPLYFGVVNADSIVALLPMMEVKSILTGKRAVSLPFTDYCEPILGAGTSFDQLFQEAVQYGRKCRWQSVQVRGDGEIDAAPDRQYCVHTLKLNDDAKRLFSNLRAAKRRNIRKAQKQQLEIQHRDDLQAVNAYYRLHCRTRKRLGVPPQPYRFFENIFNYVISKGQGKVVLARHQKQIVAGNIFFHFRQKAMYKFGASERAFQHLRPSDLIMWEAIKWYAANGCRHFCFGRTAINNTGLRRFKSDWGAAEKVINYYRYDLAKNNFVSTEKSEKTAPQTVFRRLPVPALKLVGAILYKHMG